jgi:hypothetical protein
MGDYRERLYVPLAWWLLAIPIVLTIGGTLYAGLPWPWPIIIFAVLTIGLALPLYLLGRATVEVADGMLQAGPEVLPLAVVSEVIALDEKQTTRLRGPRGDPAAVLYSRPYLKQSVYLALDESAQHARERKGITDVPYWQVGTRHPAELAAAIERCRVRRGPEPVA